MTCGKWPVTFTDNVVPLTAALVEPCTERRNVIARAADWCIPRSLRSWIVVLAVVLGAIVAPVPALPVESLPGSVLWAAQVRYDGHEGDVLSEVEVSPDGSAIYMAGNHYGGPNYSDFVTVARDAATGTKLWVSGYDGTGHNRDHVSALTVSPDGSTVFVTGSSNPPMIYADDDEPDYVTIAYDARTGAQRWIQRYNGPDNSNDYGAAVSVGLDGTQVFVTGTSPGFTTGSDFLTFAYDATTGAELWHRRQHWGSADWAAALALSPDGSSVFVTGQAHLGGQIHYATVAYDASTGARLWADRPQRGGSHDANAIAVSPDGSQVFVTGLAEDPRSRDWAYLTVGYDAATGARLWSDRYQHEGIGQDQGRDVGVSPDGTKVYVTGSSADRTNTEDYVTIAYDSVTGSRVWVRRYKSAENGNDLGYALGVSPDGITVFVTGSSNTGTQTIAYEAATGATLWTGASGGRDLDLSPDGSVVFVTHGSGTVAYKT